LESFSKYLISDVPRRIETKEAIFEERIAVWFGLGRFFGKCGVDSSVFRQRTLALSCEHGNTVLFYIIHETGFSWGNLE
jgi:hypothetical protein